jgi:metal-responsive CopG/Arc/MetJ family transcriptional regulator
MVVELKEYESAGEIAKCLDSEVSRTKSMLGEYLRRLDEIRSLAERSKKVRDVVFKLAGKKAGQQNLGEMTVGNLSVILDANPFHELTAIEEAVRSQQERLLVLQKTREALNWVDQIEDTEGLRYLVLENDGVPEKILLKIA